MPIEYWEDFVKWQDILHNKSYPAFYLNRNSLFEVLSNQPHLHVKFENLSLFMLCIFKTKNKFRTKGIGIYVFVRNPIEKKKLERLFDLNTNEIFIFRDVFHEKECFFF